MFSKTINHSIEKSIEFVDFFVKRNRFIDFIVSNFVREIKKKINELLNKKVFDVLFLIEVFSKIKLFNFRFVDKIKNFKISIAFEKFRLIIQIFNNQKKKL